MNIRNSHSGFTIVELLIVIVIVGILATLTIIAYSNVQAKATASSLISDLDSASKQLKLYQVDKGNFPTANDCSVSPATSSICLKSSNGATYSAFQIDNTANTQSFCLTAIKNSISYRTTNDSVPVVGTCSGVLASGVSCPTGYIVVPGSSTYGTSDFCIMKYEAKNVAGVATSQAAGSPWTNISHIDALDTVAPAACSGCHLTTESEWMTLAQNVLTVPSNWSSGAVGSGYVYSGHTDNGPANALSADSSDTNGYSGTGQSSPSGQRRNLTLTNGEVIWDMSGNVWEWTAGKVLAWEQPGITGESTYSWKDWPNITAAGSLTVNPVPGTIGISGANSWTSAQGIGQLFSYSNEVNLRGTLRSGDWNTGASAGVLTLDLFDSSWISDPAIGFRVSK